MVAAFTFASGDAALRLFAPGGGPVLWPEHFDVAIDLDEVTYGVSLGDAEIAGPYAYVAPWGRPAVPSSHSSLKIMSAVKICPAVAGHF